MATLSTSTTATCAGDEADDQNLQDIDHDKAQQGDVVVGVPLAGSGAVDVRLTSGGRQHLTQEQLDGLPSPGASDRFGASIAYLRADADFCSDLAIGVPGAQGGRGAVVIAKGSTEGIASTGAVWLPGSTPGEAFGSQVVVSGKDLFVSAPGRTVSGRSNAGAIDHYLVGDDGVPSLVETISENTVGVPGVPELNDRFGEVLATGGAWLVVGQPSEDAGSRVDVGAVTVLTFDSTTHRLAAARTITQDSPGVSGVGEAGDRFGAAIAGGYGALAVGVPGEDVGSAKDAGMVQTFFGTSPAKLRFATSLTQNSPYVPGAVEPGDRFGASVAVDVSIYCVTWDDNDMAIGAPGEDVGTVRDAGTVTLLPLREGLPASAGNGANCRHAWYQGSGGLGGVAEAGDQLGATLGVSTYRYMWYEDVPQTADLLIGVPGEDVGSARDAGGVHKLGLGSGRTSVVTFGDSTGRAIGTRFGSVFATSS